MFLDEVHVYFLGVLTKAGASGMYKLQRLSPVISNSEAETLVLDRYLFLK